MRRHLLFFLKLTMLGSVALSCVKKSQPFSEASDAKINFGSAASFSETPEKSKSKVEATKCSHSPSHFRCVEYVQNYDGDTITVNIPGVHPIVGDRISVRVIGVDTAEKNGQKPCEKQKAKEAQRLVENLLKRAKGIELANVQRDKYFRILADVKVDGQSLSELLVKNKLAYSYDGGRKPANYNWCKR